MAKRLEFFLDVLSSKKSSEKLSRLARALGLILDSKLNFMSHIREAVLKAQKGIALLKYLSKFVSGVGLDHTHNLYVRPDLNYGDTV